MRGKAEKFENCPRGVLCYKLWYSRHIKVGVLPREIISFCPQKRNNGRPAAGLFCGIFSGREANSVRHIKYLDVEYPIFRVVKFRKNATLCVPARQHLKCIAYTPEFDLALHANRNDEKTKSRVAK